MEVIRSYFKHISIIWAVFISIILYNCTSQDKFEIHGTFTVLDPTPVKLYHLGEDHSELIDSVIVKTEPSFKLSGQTDKASIYVLKFFNDQTIYLVIKKGDKISFEIDNSKQEILYYVEGSFDSKLVKEIIDKQNIVLKKIDELSRVWELYKTDTILKRKIDSSYASIIREHQQFTKKFIKDNPGSLANIFALYQNFGKKSQPLFDKYDDIDIFNFVDSNLTCLYPETEAVVALNKDVTEIKEQIAHKNYINKRVNIGSLLPGLKATDINGDTIYIPSRTDPKPVLILFWASFNKISVDILKDINDFSNSKQGKKLNIVTISIDTSAENLKQFLTENVIELPVICDYQYWNSDIIGKYAVKKIPYTILSGKLGVIKDMDVYNENLMISIENLINE
ncbi:MAG: AhpC/TSA family protein [Bacteroidales bacterium]|nr:AhpC/TSA family protein [Bacteroidales bacterium]